MLSSPLPAALFLVLIKGTGLLPLGTAAPYISCRDIININTPALLWGQGVGQKPTAHADKPAGGNYTVGPDDDLY